jgi:polysaccharide biosynthesis protein PslG
MKFRSRICAIILMLVLCAGSLGTLRQPVEANTGAIYFPETGFWVDADFARFWETNGGLMVFGYPVTRVFYQDGLHRQYFERAIFEHHEDEDEPFHVLLVRMGALNTIDQRRVPDGPFAPVEEPFDDTIWFPETGHTLSGIFLEYWLANGDVQSFGYPLSEPTLEPGIYDGVTRLVQYFERARLEHHPDKAGTEFEILLGHLGVEYLQTRTVPEIALTRLLPTARDRDGAPISPQPLFDRDPVTCGFNYAFWGDLANDVTNQHYLDMLVETGCDWVRMQFTWYDLEPYQGAPLVPRLPGYKRVIDRANERGLNVLVNVSHAPDWALTGDPHLPADPEAFADFMGRLAGEFAGQIAAWQIWNEPNLIDETHQQVSPEGYLELVRLASPAIRQADPDALIVSPGLGPTGLMYDDWALDDAWYLEYLFGLNNGEIIDYFDVIALHAYGAGNSPDTYWPSNPAENPGWVEGAEFYFRRAEEMRRIIEFAGINDKPVWITETGWTLPNSNPMYGYGDWMTEELQAAYLSRALEIIQTEWDWVDQVFIWHFNAAPYSGVKGPFYGFSMLRTNGSPRPVLLEVQGWREELLAR